MLGRSAAFSKAFSRRYARWGLVGTSGFNGWGKIHSVSADFFRSCRSSEVLAGSRIFRPQTSSDLRVEEIMPRGVSFDCVHETLQLGIVQNLLLLGSCLGECDALRGILCDEPRLFCGLHSSVEHGVDAADHTVRQLVTIFWVFADAPVGTQVIIHILDIRRSDFGDLLPAKSWLDVEIDISAVPASSAGPDDACHDTVQPIVQPLAQREFLVVE